MAIVNFLVHNFDLAHKVLTSIREIFNYARQDKTLLKSFQRLPQSPFVFYLNSTEDHLFQKSLF